MPAQIRWLAFRVAIVAAAALLLALVGTSTVSSATNTVGEDVTQTTRGMAAALDTLPSRGKAEPTLVGVLASHDHDDDDRFWWIVGPIMMVIFWGGIIAVAVWGIRQFTRGRDKGQSPLDIAKERYARGEITKEEFEKLRRDLG